MLWNLNVLDVIKANQMLSTDCQSSSTGLPLSPRRITLLLPVACEQGKDDVSNSPNVCCYDTHRKRCLPRAKHHARHVFWHTWPAFTRATPASSRWRPSTASLGAVYTNTQKIVCIYCTQVGHYLVSVMPYMCSDRPIFTLSSLFFMHFKYMNFIFYSGETTLLF